MASVRVIRSWLLVGIAIAGSAAWSQSTLAQTAPANSNGSSAHDPGVRGGAAGAGGALPGLNAAEQAFFTNAKDVFQEIDSVSGTIPGEAGAGLGPRFNMNSCSGCHAQPDVGGSSPFTNPQVAVATLDGAKNTVPPFITKNGPVREVRFINNPDGTPDGGVHDLFVISGRTDAPGCGIVQPNFAAAVNADNAIFRIPTPVFGAGLVEGTPDDALQAALAQSASAKSQAGISGEFNHSGNDGTITRFGWKAQNKSMLMFAGEAYNVEQGVTNELFPNERETDHNCQFNGTPEDRTALDPAHPTATPGPSDIVNFSAFARLSNGPTPVPSALPNTQRGSVVFNNIGCALCHTVSQTTGKSAFTNQSNKTFQPYSDFAVHAMGNGLADDISQGGAAGNEFRSAPLWGAGQRIFFLHDGRTSDIIQAIEQHASRGSEANQVINNFNMLGAGDAQALVNFLRSL